MRDLCRPFRPASGPESAVMSMGGRAFRRSIAVRLRRRQWCLPGSHRVRRDGRGRSLAHTRLRSHQRKKLILHRNDFDGPTEVEGRLPTVGAHMNAITSPITTRVYRLATVTPRHTSAMTPSGGSLMGLGGITLLPWSSRPHRSRGGPQIVPASLAGFLAGTIRTPLCVGSCRPGPWSRAQSNPST